MNNYPEYIPIYDQCTNIKYENKYPHHRRTIAIGDIHGDLGALLSCLADVAKVIEYHIDNTGCIKFNWIGGDTYVVLVGDIIDRKRDCSVVNNGYLVGEIDNEEVIILDLLNKIAEEAVKWQGKLIKLLGNHEVMNLLGYFKYVSDNTLRENGGIDGRRELMKRGGILSKKIIDNGTLGIVKIGDWVFVHGGLLPALVKSIQCKGIKKGEFIDKANDIARRVFLDELKNESEEELFKLYFFDNNIKTGHDLIDLYNTRDSLLNERRLSLHTYGGIEVETEKLCTALKDAFKMLGFNDRTNIVVAHSVQMERGLRPMPKAKNGFVSGYVYKKLLEEDESRYVYGGPGVRYEGKIDDTYQNIFPHGINFECPTVDNKSGHIWRIDTAQSRGFDDNSLNKIYKKYTEKILKARRPSALEILYNEKDGYTVRVLVAKKGLPRDIDGVNDVGPIFD